MLRLPLRSMVALAFAALFFALGWGYGVPKDRPVGFILGMVCTAFACFLAVPDPPRLRRAYAASGNARHPAQSAVDTALHAAECAKAYAENSIRAAREGRLEVARAALQAAQHASARATAAAELATERSGRGTLYLGSKAQWAATFARGDVRWAGAVLALTERTSRR